MIRVLSFLGASLIALNTYAAESCPKSRALRCEAHYLDANGALIQKSTGFAKFESVSSNPQGPSDCIASLNFEDVQSSPIHIHAYYSSVRSYVGFFISIESPSSSQLPITARGGAALGIPLTFNPIHLPMGGESNLSQNVVDVGFICSTR